MIVVGSLLIAYDTSHFHLLLSDAPSFFGFKEPSGVDSPREKFESILLIEYTLNSIPCNTDSMAMLISLGKGLQALGEQPRFASVRRLRAMLTVSRLYSNRAKIPNKHNSHTMRPPPPLFHPIDLYRKQRLRPERDLSSSIGARGRDASCVSQGTGCTRGPTG